MYDTSRKWTDWTRSRDVCHALWHTSGARPSPMPVRQEIGSVVLPCGTCNSLLSGGQAMQLRWHVGKHPDLGSIASRRRQAEGALDAEIATITCDAKEAIIA